MSPDYAALRRAYEWEVHRRELLLDYRGRGFMTYSFRPEAVYIEEVYVIPEARKSGVAREMLERIETLARQFDRTEVWGTVDATTKTWRESVAAQEACGFVLTSTDTCGRALLVKRLEPRHEAVAHEVTPAVVDPAVEE